MTSDSGGPSGTRVRLRDGTAVEIRAIDRADEPLLAAFHASLSPQSVYQRYFHLATLEQRVSQQQRAFTADVDPASGAALVAVRIGEDGAPAILALGRLTRAEPEGSAEIALLVADGWHRVGLGTVLMNALVATARELGLRRLYGEMLADNDAMRAVARRAGFVIRTVPGDAKVLRAERALS